MRKTSPTNPPTEWGSEAERDAYYASQPPESRDAYFALKDRMTGPCTASEAEAMGYFDRDGHWIDDPAARARRREEMDRGR